MARSIITRNISDWSALSLEDNFWSGLDLSRKENFGIHQYKGNLWTGSYVGVGRLYDSNGRFLQSEGKERIVVISSKYDMDPWKMLETVMTDDEYDDYISEMESEGKFLFRIFGDQPLIRLSQDVRHDGDILFALSFISSCYSLCKKGLKKTLFHQEKNYTSKVRGKIEIKKNIRENTCKGRSDRFYCRFIDFTEDNIENRILKATLLKCKVIIGRRFKPTSEISKQIAYCLNAFRKVKHVNIKTSDFKRANSSGLYMYYKPLLQQANCIHRQKFYTCKDENGSLITKSVFTIPYMINMEALFEFYVRIILKHSIDQSKYFLIDYSKKIYLQKNIQDISQVERGIHLIPFCIPDIIICDVNTQKPVAVFDAKYKINTQSSREDTHQLLSYVFLLGVFYCAFVFPGDITTAKLMQTTMESFLPLSAEQMKYDELLHRYITEPVRYHEIFLGNNESNISEVLENILP